MSTRGRPLSPHLSVYRFRITSTLSILHRFTGVVLTGAAVLLVVWLVAAASGAESYADAQALLGSWFGKLIIAGGVLAFFYHLGNGIRHLAWDTGRGFEMSQARATGWTVVTFAILATSFALFVAFF
ncbi:MAG: succinate dehydrogenase, cytochrome b556 subunit [Pseudomonadota bacterium]